jgi:hypothetical protein
MGFTRTKGEGDLGSGKEGSVAGGWGGVRRAARWVWVKEGE